LALIGRGCLVLSALVSLGSLICTGVLIALAACYAYKKGEREYRKHWDSKIWGYIGQFHRFTFSAFIM
jgi:hypothetical protein